MHLLSESAIWKTESEFISNNGAISNAIGETSIVYGNDIIKNNSWACFGEAITNNGKTPLVIHAINTETENMIVKADKNVIAPGKSTKVRITFTPNKKDDLKPQKIAFITNAPNALNAIVEIDILEKR